MNEEGEKREGEMERLWVKGRQEMKRNKTFVRDARLENVRETSETGNEATLIQADR